METKERQLNKNEDCPATVGYSCPRMNREKVNAVLAGENNPPTKVKLRCNLLNENKIYLLTRRSFLLPCSTVTLYKLEHLKMIVMQLREEH